ncbi:PadR family transcriptional regulator [bacterium]|nr:PadR family transcriptional regulator [bacterium]
MIELLILYSIHKRENTIYGIRKNILDIFGAFTKPSIGTIHPALKRLMKANAVTLTERFSEGGKKSSYYSITEKGKQYFKDKFFNATSDNPSLFYTELQIKLGTMGLLSIEDRKKFITFFSRKIDIFEFELENTLNDEYLELDYFQSELLKKTLKEIKELKEYLRNLKVE